MRYSFSQGFLEKIIFNGKSSNIIAYLQKWTETAVWKLIIIE